MFHYEENIPSIIQYIIAFSWRNLNWKIPAFFMYDTIYDSLLLSHLCFLMRYYFIQYMFLLQILLYHWNFLTKFSIYECWISIINCMPMDLNAFMERLWKFNFFIFQYAIDFFINIELCLNVMQTMTNFEALHKLHAHNSYILMCLLSPELCDPHRF